MSGAFWEQRSEILTEQILTYMTVMMVAQTVVHSLEGGPAYRNPAP